MAKPGTTSRLVMLALVDVRGIWGYCSIFWQHLRPEGKISSQDDGIVEFVLPPVYIVRLGIARLR